MSDDSVRAAMTALANAELPGHPPSAEVLTRQADLRRRLERAARGPPVLEKGIPATLAVVCGIAAVIVTQVIAADRSPALAATGWAAFAVFALIIAAAGRLVFRER
jgi:hypothetical protein